MAKDKHCGIHDDDDDDRKNLFRTVFAVLLALIILILILILIIWLVLRPTKPKILLQDIQIQQFNLINQNIIQITMQATIASRNPNKLIGIYYDRLDVFAEYKAQHITAATRLPTGYQGHGDVNVWSPYLYGVAVPVAPYVGVYVAQDFASGFVLLYVKLDGRLRWKVGTWISGKYHIQANCPAFLTVVNGTDGVPKFRFQRMTACNVNV